VRQANTLRPKALQQFRNSEKVSLHVFRQRKQFSFHYIVQNLNRLVRHLVLIALLI